MVRYLHSGHAGMPSDSCRELDVTKQVVRDLMMPSILRGEVAENPFSSF